MTAQLLDRMSRKQSELEVRLDDMLSRIAMETQEIKELEQQLTDGEEPHRGFVKIKPSLLAHGKTIVSSRSDSGE